MALGLAAALSHANELTKENKDEILKGIKSIIETAAFVPHIDFRQWDTFLEKHRTKIDEANTEEAFTTAVNEGLGEFGFSHIVLLSPKSAQAMREGASVGIGATLRVAPEGLQFLRVLPNSPTQEAGIQVGDTIVEVDGIKNPQSRTPIRGEEGTVVNFKIKSLDGKVRDVQMTRRKFSTVIPESLEWLDDKTAVLSIPTFHHGYNAKRIDELIKEAAKAENLIVDLRFNGGGAVTNMISFMGYFLPSSSKIGAFVGRHDLTRYKKTWGADGDVNTIAFSAEPKMSVSRQGGPVYTGRLAVLIDPNSGSAAEITAAAFRELLHAPVVGEKSAGAVLASVYGKLPHGFELQYPISDYVTIFGRRLEGNGVVPDVEVKDQLRLPGYGDVSVEKARMLLERKRMREVKAAS